MQMCKQCSSATRMAGDVDTPSSLSHAALGACGCVIYRSNFNTFMLSVWLPSVNVQLLEVRHLNSGLVQSGLLVLLDVFTAQMSQSVRCYLAPLF